LRTRRGGNTVEAAEVRMTEASDNAAFSLKIVEETLVLLAAFVGSLEGGREGGRARKKGKEGELKTDGREGGRKGGTAVSSYLDHFDSDLCAFPRG